MSGSTQGGVDSSIALQAGRGVPQNALASQDPGQVLNTLNSVNQLRLFPLQQQQQQLHVQQQQVEIAGQQLQQNLTRLNAGVGFMLPLLMDQNGNPTTGISSGDIARTLADASDPDSGLMTAGQAAGLLQRLPDGGADPVKNRQFVLQLYASNRAAAGQHEAALAQLGMSPGVQSNGQSIQPGGVAGPLTQRPGAFKPEGQATPMQMSPGEASTPTPIGVVPPGQQNAGAPVMGTRQQFVGAAGGQSPFGTGRLPSALRNPNAPPAAAPGVVTQPGPAAVAAGTAQGAQSQTAFQNIATQGVQARSQAAILDTMLGDTAQFVTGPGQEGINQFRKVVQRIAPWAAPSFGIDPRSVAANESFDKFANQLADAQGAGSDARLAVNQGANPSSHLSPAGVDLVIRQLRGNADYLTARAQLAATYADQTDRTGFEAKIGANLDPRVFQYTRMTPQQKTTFYSATPNKAEFQRAYRYAAQNNLIASPQRTPAPATAAAAPAPVQPPAVPTQ